MITHVSKSKFKAKAFEYFRQVETSGEPIVITDNGKPVLEMRRFSELSATRLRFCAVPFFTTTIRSSLSAKRIGKL